MPNLHFLHLALAWWAFNCNSHHNKIFSWMSSRITSIPKSTFPFKSNRRVITVCYQASKQYFPQANVFIHLDLYALVRAYVASSWLLCVKGVGKTKWVWVCVIVNRFVFYLMQYISHDIIPIPHFSTPMYPILFSSAFPSHHMITMEMLSHSVLFGLLIFFANFPKDFPNQIK